MSERVRVAFTMQRSDHEEMTRIAAAEGLTFSEYLRRSLATYRYIKSRTCGGAKLLVEQDGKQSEVIFR